VWHEKFLQGQMKKLSIKITSLAKYFAGAERNDEVGNGLETFAELFRLRPK
jgi:hypothetical protein